jgi:hypothetical protein
VRVYDVVDDVACIICQSLSEGSIWKHHNLRISYIAQHSMHHLESNLEISPKEYIQTRFFLGRDRELATMAGGC